MALEVLKGFFEKREEVFDDIKASGYWPATLVSQASPGLPVHWHDHNVHAYLVEGTTDFLDAETGIRYNVGPWMARRGDPRGPSNAHVRAYM